MSKEADLPNRNGLPARVAMLLASVFGVGCAGADGASPYSAVRSHAYLARAGTGHARAGFGAAAVYSGSDGSGIVHLPAVQAMVGLDVGRHYALHGIANGTGLGLDGALIAVNRPALRVGLAHGVVGRVSGFENGTAGGLALGAGPYLTLGTATPVLVALRWDSGASVERYQYSPMNLETRTSGWAHTASAAIGVTSEGVFSPTVELGYSRSDVTGDSSSDTMMLSFSLFGEVRQ